MNKQKNAFTLVELIVVITILAILGTIAFISLQGYSTSARDSTRISDISSIKTSLELFNLEAGKYPIPTNGVDITYSGAVVWNQGTFGKTVFTNVSKLDKIPLDPTTDKEYTYSVNSNRYEYQLGGIIEGDVVVMNNLVSQTNAGETIATAYVTGNYNGLMTKSNSGTICNVLAIPTIITNDTSITDLQLIVTNNSFVYRGYKNLPSSFKTSKFKYNGGFLFTPNNLIAYTDTGACTALTDINSYTARVNLLKGLQDAYSGTILKNEGEIKNIVGLNINTSSPSVEVINYAGNFVNNVFGGIIVSSSSSSSGGGNSCNSTQPTHATLTTGSPTSLNQAWQSANPSNSCYFTCNIGYGSTGNDCSNICISGMTEITLTNGQTWSCMNLGATAVRDGSIPPINCGGTSTNCNSGLAWLGDYYQWGRNDTGWTDGQSGSPYNYGWEAQNDTKWGGSTGDTTTSDGVGTTAVGRQGPCPSGWHVPSLKDWKSACNTISGTSCANNSTTVNVMKDTLRLPFAGGRNWDNGYYNGQSIGTQYWASSPYLGSAYNLYFITSIIDPANYSDRARGLSVRCIKN